MIEKYETEPIMAPSKRSEIFIIINVIIIDAIIGFIEAAKKLKLTLYFAIKYEYSIRKNISEITVAIAAPINPNLGIRIRFSIMFIAVTVPWLKTLEPCLSIEDSIVPEIIFTNLRPAYQIKICNAKIDSPNPEP